MKTTFFYMVFFSVMAGFTVRAQELIIPQMSTKQSITQDLGAGQITLTYSRPNVNDRKIFGSIQPYGMAWRTGDNAATTIKLTNEVTIADKKIPAGEYVLFSIPGEKEWTFILNKTPKQRSAYNYKEGDILQWDAYDYIVNRNTIRFTVPAIKTAKFTETLTMQFTDAVESSCSLQMNWENTEVLVNMKTDDDKLVMENIAKAMDSEQKPYYMAAVYYYNHNKNIAKALHWITIQDKVQPNACNVKYWKACIQLKTGDKENAIATATEGLKLAQKNNNTEYIRLNQEVLSKAQENSAMSSL